MVLIYCVIKKKSYFYILKWCKINWNVLNSFTLKIKKSLCETAVLPICTLIFKDFIRLAPSNNIGN